MSLATGDRYTVTKRTPLMPEFRPRDPLFAVSKKGLERIVWITKGESFVVMGTRMKRTIMWYQAEAFDKNGASLGKGWINSVALLGPGIDIKADAH